MTERYSEIAQLSPSLIWGFFDKICSIPHPSYHEEALADFIVSWANEQGLEVKRDPVGNIFIKKPATPGMENRKGVVLQAHLDMVPQKNDDTQHDFLLDPIRPYIDGEWVTARGTTLGADNGIGMATCLAVLAADDLKHGPLEVLLTINEESGMSGAFGLQSGWLEGDILLNTDSEQEGEVYVGCAGGINGLMEIPVERQEIPAGYRTIKLILKGLRGGHSGVDIHLGRGNANKLLARFLADTLETLPIQLVEFTGGTLRNAIPREGYVTVACAEDQFTQLTDAFARFIETAQAELSKTEPNLTGFTEQLTDTSALQMITPAATNLVAATLNSCPNGVIRMSDDIEGVVESSLNIGVVKTEQDSVSLLILIRSLIDSGRRYTESMINSVAKLSQANIRFYDAYPGWSPDTDSPVMALFREKYEAIYGHKPNIMVIHAGLECGLFKKPYPDMDMISFGPTIKFPHSPDEKVKIDTVEQFWLQMTTILANIPEKSA